MRKLIVQKLKRVVIKIGSGIITTERGLKKNYFSKLARELAQLSRSRDIVIVSSGAIASGMGLMKLRQRPEKISKKQAVASLGQPLLMQAYARAFSREKLNVSQILVTREDLQDRQRQIKARHVFNELFAYRVIPIVNENDTVATEEIKFGDNDQLSALVAHLVSADLLLLMTDTDGFFDRDPKKFKDAQRLALIENVEEKHFRLAKDTSNQRSTGGMITKIKAAQQAAAFGIPTWIVSGHDPRVLQQVVAGEDVGTLFLPGKDKS